MTFTPAGAQSLWFAALLLVHFLSPHCHATASAFLAPIRSTTATDLLSFASSSWFRHPHSTPYPLRLDASRGHTALIPEENPHAQPQTRSPAGVAYGDVLAGLHQLYPPASLEARNAVSRTDGYWPYVQQGQDPPKPLTYGEFDFYFFAQLLDRAAQYSAKANNNSSASWKDCVFCDLGSGAGRLVLAAAALHEWRTCRGVELLPGLSDEAQQKLEQCHCQDGDDPKYVLPGSNVPLLAPVELVCESLADPYVYFGDADLVFCFSSCMGAELMESLLGAAVGRQCQPGTIVITTDYMLPLQGTVPPVENDDRIPTGEYTLSLLEKVDGWCWLTGGASTAYIHRVETSVATAGKCWEPPVPTLQDQAWEVVQAYEAGTLTDTNQFLRNVYNSMVFSGLPDSFLPKLNRDREDDEEDGDE